MKFEQIVLLIGVVGKKGFGKLDNGQEWATDRVELHCLGQFPESDTMAHGQTAIVYNVENYLVHYEPAKQLIDQQIVLKMEMIPAKKLGSAPRMICTGFEKFQPKKSA